MGQLFRDFIGDLFGQYEWARRFARGKWELYNHYDCVIPDWWYKTRRNRFGYAISRCPLDYGWGMAHMVLDSEEWDDNGERIRKW